MSVTVKQYKDLLEEMKKVYPYEDEKTNINCMADLTTRYPRLEIQTEDEATGITVIMRAEFDRSDGNEQH